MWNYRGAQPPRVRDGNQGLRTPMLTAAYSPRPEGGSDSGAHRWAEKQDVACACSGTSLRPQKEGTLTPAAAWVALGVGTPRERSQAHTQTSTAGPHAPEALGSE